MGSVCLCGCFGRRLVPLLGVLLVLPLLSSCDTRSVTTSGADMDTVLASNVTATDIIFEVTSTAGFPFTGTITVKSGDSGPVLETTLASPAAAADTRFEVASTEEFPSAGTIELTAEYDHSLEATLKFAATATATLFEVESTDGFPSAGTLEFPNGFEQVTYTSTTPTTFRGLTRGANSTTAANYQPGNKMVLHEVDNREQVTYTSTTPTTFRGLTRASSGTATFYTTGQKVVLVDETNSVYENITYTSTTPTTFRGLTRGANDTTAVRHSVGVRISLLETEVNTDDSKGSTLVRTLIVGGLLIGIGSIM